MDQWAAQTAADDTKEDADADAAMNATNSTADALDIKEKNEADAQQKKDDGDAQAVRDKAVNDAQATHDRSISDAGNITSAIAKDAYFATLPDVYPAFTWDPTLNPALFDASYDEVYAVDDLALPLSAGQDDGNSPLPPGDVIGNDVNGIPSPAPSPQSPAPLLGQSFSLGATTDPYSGIATAATPMVTTLLNDNGVYDPGNPFSSFTGWPGSPFLTGQTMPLPGGQSGNYTFMPTSDGPPQTGGGQGGGGGGQQGEPAVSVPPTNAGAPRMEGDKEKVNDGRNWNVNDVQNILKALAPPEFANWWGKFVGYNGVGANGPKIGNIQPSNYGWLSWIWGQDDESVNVAKGGTMGDRPIAVNVPDDWSSEQVAQYILEQSQPGSDIATEFYQYLEKQPGVDAIVQGGKLHTENIKEGLETGLSVIRQYVQFMATLTPGGQGVFAVNDAFHGHFIAAIVGVVTLVPGEKVIDLLNRIGGKFTLRFANKVEVVFTEKAIAALRGMAEGDRANWIKQLKGAANADEAAAIISKLEDLAGPLHHLGTNKNFLSELRGGPWSPKFKELFDEAGMTLDDAANKVYVPGHKGPHPEEYHQAIWDRLKAATEGRSGAAYKKALLDALEIAGRDAQTYGTDLNNLLRQQP